MENDYYSVLCLTKYASSKEIEEAYEKLINVPDEIGTNSVYNLRRISVLKEAYSVLSNDSLRFIYDDLLKKDDDLKNVLKAEKQKTNNYKTKIDAEKAELTYKLRKQKEQFCTYIVHTQELREKFNKSLADEREKLKTKLNVLSSELCEKNNLCEILLSQNKKLSSMISYRDRPFKHLAVIVAMVVFAIIFICINLK